jgi:hypothetical protein
MGLLPHVARILLAEHKKRAIEGDFLMIARQTTFVDEHSADKLLTDEGVAIRRSRHIKYDTNTRSATQSPKNLFLTDESFVSFFAEARVKALDVSEYEGADFVCDLNHAIPETLHGVADFIYNGSCLDNVFNPAQAIVNLSKMLRPKGRILHLEHGTHVNCPYQTFNPAWFLDYYMLNSFAECSIYIGYFNKIMGPWSLYQWNPYVLFNSERHCDWDFIPPSTKNYMIVVVAEKSDISTNHLLPTQAQYRSPGEQKTIAGNVATIASAESRNQTKAWTRPTFLRKLLRFASRQTLGSCDIAVQAGLWPNFNFVRRLKAA